MKKFTMGQRILSVLLSLAIVIGYIPAMASAADTAEPFYNRVVDANTMDNWTKYFNVNDLTTVNAGGVWTDKSVFTDAEAFGGKISMLNSNQNFLTALSALAANKEVVGYSTVPTDTVLVLDLSGSMSNSDSEEDLIDAANSAIQTLLNTNENNRVGVALYSASGSTGTSTYSQSVTRILPIDRYTTGSDGKYLSLSSQGRVSVDRDVRGTVANADLDNTKSFGGGTYIQAGLFEAMKMFKEMDTVVGDNNWQSGDDRMPILVLMSDGACSTGTSNYTNVGTSNVGNGNESNLTAGNAFLTQLTAAYVMAQIEAHYQKNNPDVRGLFYTLGFNISGNNIAKAVMNPDSTTLTDALWRSYLALGNGQLTVNVKGTSSTNNNSRKDVTVTKNSYVTGKSYVDKYFDASGNGLANAFNSIVEEIILQSRYYPTHLEGGSPDFSGYVTFTDDIGEYMEVKDIKGILLGNTLYDGRMMASKLELSGEGGLGTVENPTELGTEFIRAIKTRLGIADNATAQALVNNAFVAGQLKYNSATDWSNYIGWYAKADGTYAGFWNENPTAAAPANAVYKIKSYGFLGETKGSIKNSDMMYMSLQVRTNIATGMQTVLWSIPASLVPLVTYEVSLKGTNVDTATDVKVEVKDAASISPIRLVFESGLRSDQNELNITRITDAKHIADDGVTRQFWSNYFDISAADHDNHKVTLAAFTPSKENERFYFTFDSAVFKKSGNSYVLVDESEGANGALNAQGEYYHRRYIFTETSSKPIFYYEKMSAASIGAARWDAGFVTLTNDVGAWVVPAGTPARELRMYDEQKADEHATKSAHMVFYPYLTEQNGIFHVDMNLGNNGLLEVTPAQGIKLSKTVDIFETGTSDAFSFRITIKNADGTPFSGKLNSWTTALDVVPLGAATEITVSSGGMYTVNLKRDQSFWLTELPTGATYTVEEISGNEDYKIKSIHVNGISMSGMAVGKVAAHYIDEVDFINTAMGEGDLVITKQVVDATGAAVDVADSISFTAEITLTNPAGQPVSGSFQSSKGTLTVPANGKFTVTLTDGASFVVRGIPEMTRYTVVETNIPNGFRLNEEKSSLSGIVDAAANDQALIVNTYDPTGTDGAEVDVVVSKTITGNRTEWMDGESYTFQLERLDVSRGATVIATTVIDKADADKSHLFSLSSEVYPEAGTYYYRITEQPGSQGGITYDTAERRFSVVVADQDMDGDLEIVAVNNEVNTTVTGTYLVSATFNNVYQPTGTASVTVDIQKKMNGSHSLAGFQFVLLDSDDLAEASEILRSNVTGTNGQASITLNYAANRATMEGAVFTYYLTEVNTGNPNIAYDTAIYKVDVTVKDMGDGTVTATAVVTPHSGGAVEAGKATFTNTYVPSASDFVTISGEKVISGDRVLNAGEFAFVLGTLTLHAPMPAETVVYNNADGSFSFPAIEFTTPGTFAYYITERFDNPIGGFTYDQAVYDVTIQVVDNGDATLSATIVSIDRVTVAGISAAEEIVFTNLYDATDASVVVDGTKILTGKTMQDGEFTFRLSAVTDGAPMPAAADVTNTASGAFSFGSITYSKAGVYVYKVTEENGGDARYDYDQSEYLITVTVTDNSRGALSAEVTMTKNGVAASQIVFRNGFVPTPITYDIYTDFGGKKALEGRPMEAGEFEFRLINAINGQQIGKSVKNNASGDFKFPAVTLTTPGIYHYKITETVGDANGVTYDKSSFHVRLEVVQDDSGVLHIADKQLHKGTVSKVEAGGVFTEVTTYENITANGTIRFTNTYNAAPVSVTLEATKVLEGRDLVDGEFKFDLHKTDSTYAIGANTLVQDDVVLKLQADGTGKIVFNTEEFTQVGTYYYVIVEDEVDEKGITTHKTPYKVEVTVTDDLNGNLVASLKVNGEAVTGSTATTIKFNNVYAAEKVGVNLEATKVLEGRDLVDGEFKFDLHKTDSTYAYSANTLVQDDVALKLQADGTGKIVFNTEEFTQVGTYYYVIVEDEVDEKGITTHKTPYKVEVTVTDDLNGNLVASLKVNGEAVTGSTATTIKFNNTYNVASNQILIQGTKTLNGRDMVAGEFAFELHDENGLVETAYNKGNGTFAFTTIPVAQAGEKVYTVKEVKGIADGMTYDTTVYTVKVTVTDQLDGTLKVEYTYQKGSQSVEGVHFTNTYTPPEDPDKTGDDMNIGLWIGIMTVSAICLVATAATGMKRKEFEVE